jgi:hypothetical protein
MTSRAVSRPGIDVHETVDGRAALVSQAPRHGVVDAVGRRAVPEEGPARSLGGAAHRVHDLPRLRVAHEEIVRAEAAPAGMKRFMEKRATPREARNAGQPEEALAIQGGERAVGLHRDPGGAQARLCPRRSVPRLPLRRITRREYAAASGLSRLTWAVSMPAALRLAALRLRGEAPVRDQVDARPEGPARRRRAPRGRASRAARRP